jgi:hypothetical protein
MAKDPKPEKLKMIAEFRRVLEKKIEAAKTDLHTLETLLELVNETLLEKGFKRAAALETTPISKEEPAAKATPIPPQPLELAETVTPLRTSAGVALAEMYSRGDSLRVVIAKDITLNMNTPPFQQFLIERVLHKMRDKDHELTRKGELAAENAVSYEILKDGDVLREIQVDNLTQERFRELRSSIHWTLEKMYEKT